MSNASPRCRSVRRPCTTLVAEMGASSPFPGVRRRCATLRLGDGRFVTVAWRSARYARLRHGPRGFVTGFRALDGALRACTPGMAMAGHRQVRALRPQRSGFLNLHCMLPRLSPPFPAVVAPPPVGGAGSRSSLSQKRAAPFHPRATPFQSGATRFGSGATRFGSGSTNFQFGSTRFRRGSTCF